MELKIISVDELGTQKTNTNGSFANQYEIFTLSDFLELPSVEKSRLFLREFSNKTYFQSWHFTMKDLHLIHQAIFKTEILTSLTPKKGKTNTVIHDLKRQIEPYRNINWNNVAIKIKKSKLRAEKLISLRLAMVPWLNKRDNFTAKISTFLDLQTSRRAVSLDKLNVEYDELVDMFPEQAAQEFESSVPVTFENYIAELPAYSNYKNRMKQVALEESKELEKIANEKTESLSIKAASRRKFIKTLGLAVTGFWVGEIANYFYKSQQSINPLEFNFWNAKNINEIEFDLISLNPKIEQWLKNSPESMPLPHEELITATYLMKELYRNLENSTISNNTTCIITMIFAKITLFTNLAADPRTPQTVKEPLIDFLVEHMRKLKVMDASIDPYILKHNCMIITIGDMNIRNQKNPHFKQNEVSQCGQYFRLNQLFSISQKASVYYHIKFTKKGAGELSNGSPYCCLMLFLSDRLLNAAIKAEHITQLTEIANFYEQKLIYPSEKN